MSFIKLVRIELVMIMICINHKKKLIWIYCYYLKYLLLTSCITVQWLAGKK